MSERISTKNIEWKILMSLDKTTYTLINLSNGHYCELIGNFNCEELYDLDNRLKTPL